MELRCPHCHTTRSSSDLRPTITGYGHFQRKSDGAKLQRFRCGPCRRTFSEATTHLCVHQNKRTINRQVFLDLVSGVSQRRCARNLRVNRKTVVRKLLFLSRWSEALAREENLKAPPATEVQFDDLETFEHSKCKPLSVIAMVENKSRRILGFRVARMSAKGLLAKIARKRYGPRKDERRQKRSELLAELKPLIAERAVIYSDENPHYPQDVQASFPNCQHIKFKGRRGCVVGQGELKAGGYDPLFSLNHTFAMKRANINRLFRRTWNTTKTSRETLGAPKSVRPLSQSRINSESESLKHSLYNNLR